MNLDEIYDLFMWNTAYSVEEYAAREGRGIAEASKLKNLYPFILPVVLPPSKSKGVWDSCAKVVAMRSDEELAPYLHLLFEWLQDMNWPGAIKVYNRLSQIPFEKLETALRYSKQRAQETNDTLWMSALEDFQKGEQYPDCYKIEEIK